MFLNNQKLKLIDGVEVPIEPGVDYEAYGHWGVFDRVIAVKISNGKIATFAFEGSIKEALDTAGDTGATYGLNSTGIKDFLIGTPWKPSSLDRNVPLGDTLVSIKESPAYADSLTCIEGDQ